jgi:hypothetical protein
LGGVRAGERSAIRLGSQRDIEDFRAD